MAVVRGQVAGFAVSRSLAADESELLNLAVDPAFRRLGVGRTLVASITSGHPGTLWLEVRESNLAARNLYETMGFKVLSRRAEYYSESHESAIVMNVHS